MSKYIIDIPKTVGMLEAVGSVHYTYFDGIQVQTIVLKGDEIEELTADYINEHFGDLQDTAYQKGFEDGKAVNDKGCEGCKYQANKELTCPCSECANNYKNQWKAKSDKIVVGDEVEVLNSGSKYLIAWFAGTSLCGFSHDGVTCRLQPSDVRKTGRHFDIASILEEMRND